MKTIQITIKNVYGNEHIYPVCDDAQLLCELLSQKTFTDRDIKILKLLGYSFEVVATHKKNL